MYPFLSLFLAFAAGVAAAVDPKLALPAAAMFVVSVWLKPAAAVIGLAASMIMIALEPDYDLLPAGSDVTVTGKRSVLESGVHGSYYHVKTREYGEIRVYGEHAGHGFCTVSGFVFEEEPVTSWHQFDRTGMIQKNRMTSILYEQEAECTRDVPAYWNRRDAAITSLGGSETQSGPLAAALVFGDRSLIPEEQLQLFQRMGVIHLLAVSGMHVGLVSGVIWLLLLRAGLSRKSALFLLLIFLPAYAAAAGGAPSVLRAVSTAAAAAVLAAWLKRVPLVELCALVGTGLLVWNPYLLFHVGYQLSFMTSFAILLSKSFLSGKGIWWKLTFTAQLISLPAVLYHFFEVSLLSMAANAFFIPLTALFLLPLSFAAAAGTGVGLDHAVTACMDMLFRPSLKALMLLDSVEGHLLVTGALTLELLTAGTIVCAVILMLLTKKKRFAAGLTAAVFIGSVYYADNRSETVVTFLDVGQGDSILIRMQEHNEHYLIDTGGELSFSDEGAVRKERGPAFRTVLPYLHGEGIQTLEKLIITHGHFDHYGEACRIAEEINIRHVYYPIHQELEEGILKELDCLEELGSEIHFISAGYFWEKNNHVFKVLHPARLKSATENDRSIVIEAGIYGTTFLFTGDIEEEAESELLAGGTLSNADVLKGAHHGSSTSTDAAFLAKVKPQTTIIQVGSGNSHGHPHHDVLERLDDIESAVYRTDHHGSVRVIVDEHGYVTKPFLTGN
ncbi:DNA internalization-related competence protein ComEC/Rec2 [Alkalicoccus luteus]|uniref:DNA internalization-related competence protein ComEC/Rec2 n=1 Tax=Alkalicoccus luteus TaxID=1237094 RepID=A0A969PVP0_9BACI|nr:DNA internalization-related competence protein ComEC/Rec2 [Alkalicoccus luteus]NJP36512.1 DNA internalization-related competence protein ComEC/Rec2 [Alkalicoccus luteus]